MKPNQNIKIFLIAFFLITGTFAFAQDAPSYRRNAVYAEIGGTGVYGSINYERLKRLKNANYFAPSIGIALPFPENSQLVKSQFYMVPLQFNWLLGQKSSKLELGVSVNPTYSTSVTTIGETETSDNEFGALPSCRIGYRYMGNKGLVVRAGFTPIIFINPWLGASVGYSF